MTNTIVRWPLIIILASLLLAPAAITSARPAPGKAPSRVESAPTPPVIAHGVWPQLIINGSFDPKQIKSPVVFARWVVDVKGRTRDIALHPSSGSKAIDRALVSYVRALRFTPAMRSGKPADWPMAREFDLSAGA